jgi:hypothetical protein
MHIQTIGDVRAALSRGLDEEPSSYHISNGRRSGEHYVTKLLHSSELIKSRGIQELQDNLVDQVSAQVTAHHSVLEVGHQARVLVVLVNNVHVQTLAVFSSLG